MESFLEKVRSILLAEFPGSREEMERHPLRKIGGFLIWNGFEGLEPLERQKRVWAVLRDHLSRDDQLRITAILTITPAEWSVMRPQEPVAAGV